MRLRSPGGNVWGWLGIFRRCPVVLSSPYPAGECFERMARVTTLRGSTSWYLDRRTVGHPDPLFLGVAAVPGIQVARWEDAKGRNSFAAYLDVRPGQEAGEGTTLTGQIGLHRDVQELLPVFGAIACLFSLGILVAGVVQLASGRMSGLLPALLFWVPATAMAGFSALGMRSLERDIPKLLEEVNGVLDSTAVFPRSSAVMAGGSNGA